jgi:hypothetical protein
VGHRHRAAITRSAPAPRHLIELLAVLSRATDFSVGCYCEDRSHCHRSLRGRLLEQAGATMVDMPGAG